MQFKPLSEQEIHDNTFLPTGTYAFTVANAQEKYAPGGGANIQLELKVSRGDGRTYCVRDTLSPANMAKLRAAAVTCGLGDHYLRGELRADDFKNRTGFAHVYLNPSRNGLLEKNVVSNYIAQGVTRGSAR